MCWLRCFGHYTHSAEQSWTCKTRVRSVKTTHTSAGQCYPQLVCVLYKPGSSWLSPATPLPAQQPEANRGGVICTHLSILFHEENDVDFPFCFSKLRENKKTAELIKTANLLFNSFEPYYMWDYIARWFEECCRCVLINVCKSELPLFNVRERMNLKIITNMVLFQEDDECTTACWEFRSSRVLIGGVLSAGWFSVRYCFFGEFLSFFLGLFHIFFLSLHFLSSLFLFSFVLCSSLFSTGLIAISI